MRIQLALNVPDIDAAIDYYQKLFGVQVAKRKPGYANFEVENPGLKLVLFESDGPDRLNHLGVEVFDDQIVRDVAGGQSQRGVEVALTEAEGCCFATQNKAVSYAPDGTMWEWYRKIDDLETFDGAHNPPATCCA
ncbi:MAG: ArsI/CadI family heavy metal resistance metalloenzyme [Pseudomonadota bacterium]